MILLWKVELNMQIKRQMIRSHFNIKICSMVTNTTIDTCMPYFGLWLIFVHDIKITCLYYDHDILIEQALQFSSNAFLLRCMCRSYYRCTQDNCRVKKRVERLAEDPRMVITTYEGRHVHSPSNDLEDSQTPSQLNNFFW